MVTYVVLSADSAFDGFAVPGTMERISVGLGGMEANDATDALDMSADGATVVMASLATNFVMEPQTHRACPW